MDGKFCDLLLSVQFRERAEVVVALVSFGTCIFVSFMELLLSASFLIHFLKGLCA